MKRWTASRNGFGPFPMAFAIALLGASVGARAQQCSTTGTNQTCSNSIFLSGGANGLFDSGTLSVNNTGTGTIAGSVFGINAANTATVTNFGNVTGGVFGINASNTANVVNFGVISGAIGVSATTSNVTQNMGSISGSIFGISADTAAVSNSGSVFGGTIGVLATTATVVNSGTIGVGTGGTAINASGTAAVSNSGTISGGAFGISGNNDASIVNSGIISGTSTGISAGSGTLSNSGTITGGNAISFASNASVLNGGTIIGNGGTAINFGAGTNTLTLQPGFAITGKVIGAGADVLQLGGTGNATFDLGLIGPSQQYEGFSTFNKTGTSTWTVTGTYSQAHPWQVQNGTLLVNGNLSPASAITVDAGGTLGGVGTISDTTVASGGTMAPGLPNSIGSLHLTGNLVLASAASYLVQVSPLAASSTSITGAASIAGALVVNGTGAVFTVGQKYPILAASGGLTGTFSSLTTTGSFGSTQPTIAYDGNDAFLVLAPASLGLPAGSPTNVTNVAHGIDAANVATPPLAFQRLYSLSPQQLQNALTQLSGEAGTGAQEAAFQITNEFLSLLVDLGSGGDAARSTTVAVPDRQVQASKAARSETFGPILRIWGAGYGGANSILGDPSGVGSHDLSFDASGFAVGLDARVSPTATLGFALAGGGTSWSLSQGLGGGRSDVFQAGVYGSRNFGAAYLSGALAYGSHWVSTSRDISFSGLDQLQGSFVGQSFSGRLETGYHLPWTPFRLTPYVALQAQAFTMPGYSESAASGASPFGLAVNSRTATGARTEIGSWAGKSFELPNGAEFDLRARVGWAHDWQNNADLAATFVTLPAAGFVVSGATPATNLLLLSNVAEWRWGKWWSVLTKLDGELARGTVMYRGLASLRYAW